MSKIKTQNKRAFTLTELLIVVIVIGVLSAVTLPKFNRVIENRKVTEAEEMMSAVRMEQERRCTLDQNYTTNFSNLSDVIASANTKNYTYSLQAQGISAKSASGDYTLKILSYEDGSYCCTGAGCKKLNKNYPDCATLSFPTSNCAGTEGGTGEPGTDPGETPECTDGEVKGSQACNGCGTQTTQKCVGGKWTNVLGTCSKTAEECAPKPQCPTKPADAVKQCECGTVTASHKCDASTNYTWVQEAFPACPTKPADVTETCSDGKTVRKKTFTCVNNVWTAGNWDKECPAVEEDCCAADFKGNFSECIKKKYGEKSIEYLCSNYGNRQQCLYNLYYGGSEITYRCIAGSSDDKLQSDTGGYSGCIKCRSTSEAAGFFAGGFLKYACTHKVPKCDITYNQGNDRVWKLNEVPGKFTERGTCDMAKAQAKVQEACNSTKNEFDCSDLGSISVGQSTNQPIGKTCYRSCSAGTIYNDVSCSAGGCYPICIINYSYTVFYVGSRS